MVDLFTVKDSCEIVNLWLLQRAEWSINMPNNNNKKDKAKFIYLTNTTERTIENDISKILAPKPQNKKDIIMPTQLIILFRQAVADVTDCREQYTEAGILSSDMTKNEGIAWLFAMYMVMGFEEKLSPACAVLFLKKYCVAELIRHFKHFYMIIAKSKNIHHIDFDAQTFEPLLDIPGYATKSKELGDKRYDYPFKEPYYSQWNRTFEKA